MFCFLFCQTNGHPKPDLAMGQPKPNPRPRCVVKANSVMSPQPPPKPQITPRVSTYSTNNKLQKNSFSFDANKPETETNGHNDIDTVDDGLAMLRRQPSIRDRKKVCFFRENMKVQ